MNYGAMKRTCLLPANEISSLVFTDKNCGKKRKKITQFRGKFVAFQRVLGCRCVLHSFRQI